MQCPNCDYALWNLATRICPECGESFAPSQFDFVPNSVRFCCPHCDQAYYGTDPHGHLVPRQFACVMCQQSIEMDQMVLRPAVGVADKATRRTELPWLERQNVGFIKGWLRTVWLGMANPLRMADAGPRVGAAASAWWFLICTIFISALVGWVIPWGIISFARGGTIAPAATLLDVLQPPVAALVIGVIGVAIWGLCTHGLLRVTGGTENTIGTTYAMLCYSSGAVVLFGVPLFGPICFMMLPIPLIWWVISAIIMVTAGQTVHAGRAMLCVLVWPLLLVVLVIGGFAASIFWGFTAATAVMGPMTGVNWPTGMNESMLVSQELETHRAMNGNWPQHGLELAKRSQGRNQLFVARASSTTEDDLPLRLSDFRTRPAQELDDAIQELMDALPDDVIAHRVGDFVFTYHGINSAMPEDGGLWTVIMIEDPDASATGTSRGSESGGTETGPTLNPLIQLDPIYVIDATGMFRGIARGGFDAALAGQNALRQQLGFAPLPDPLTVRHAQPARLSSTTARPGASVNDAADSSNGSNDAGDAGGSQPERH